MSQSSLYKMCSFEAYYYNIYQKDSQTRFLEGGYFDVVLNIVTCPIFGLRIIIQDASPRGTFIWRIFQTSLDIHICTTCTIRLNQNHICLDNLFYIVIENIFVQSWPTYIPSITDAPLTSNGLSTLHAIYHGDRDHHTVRNKMEDWNRQR